MSPPKNYGTLRTAVSTALVKSIAVTLKSYNNGAFLRGAFGYLDSTLATGEYYIFLVDSVALPANGTVNRLVSSLPVNHTSGVSSYFSIDLTDRNIKATDGVVLAVSTTGIDLTLVGDDCLDGTILF